MDSAASTGHERDGSPAGAEALATGNSKFKSPKFECSKRRSMIELLVFGEFGFRFFGFVWDFGFRISDFWNERGRH
jgi:hypothetical protein